MGVVGATRIALSDDQRCPRAGDEYQKEGNGDHRQQICRESGEERLLEKGLGRRSAGVRSAR